MNGTKQKINEDIKRLVIERLRKIPADKKISIGGEGNFTAEELIQRVEKNDDVGQKIVEIQMNYLQSLKEGLFLNE